MDKGYPRELKTIGDHIRKKRLDQGLLQGEVALLIGVGKTTIMNWERGRSQPVLWHIPGIIRFLGYAPYDPSWSYGERLTAARQALGISRERFANLVGVDESTLWRWEDGQRQPREPFRKRIKTLVASLTTPA